jgi:hypothetical protein
MADNQKNRPQQGNLNREKDQVNKNRSGSQDIGSTRRDVYNEDDLELGRSDSDKIRKDSDKNMNEGRSGNSNSGRDRNQGSRNL